MPNVTSGQRTGHKQGLVEGRIVGNSTVIVTALDIKVGDPGRTLFPEVDRITRPNRLQVTRDRSKTTATLASLCVAYANGE